MARPGVMHGYEGASARSAVLTRLRRGLDRALLGNIAALSGVQLARYILPLVTIPYLMRALGLDLLDRRSSPHRVTPAQPGSTL